MLVCEHVRHCVHACMFVYVCHTYTPASTQGFVRTHVHMWCVRAHTDVCTQPCARTWSSPKAELALQLPTFRPLPGLLVYP